MTAAAHEPREKIYRMAATCRFVYDASASSNSGSLPASFEDWLHDDASLISPEAWQEVSLPPLLAADPATSGLDSDQANLSPN